MPTRADFAPLTTSPTPTYAAGSAQLAAYNTVNAARLSAGVGAWTQNAKLDQMATSHASYLAQNMNNWGHYEVAGTPGFTAVGPSDRAAAVGYAGSVSEVLAATSAPSPEECINTLLNSVYHQVGLLGSWREVGIGYSKGGENQSLTICVLNMGTQSGALAQLPDSGSLITFPAANATAVPTVFVPVSETPNPMPDVGGAWVGAPILASMVTFGNDYWTTTYTVDKFVLKDAQGVEVPARLMANSATLAGAGVTLTADAHQGYLAPGETYLVPLAPLTANTTYTVEFSGKANSVVYAKTWSFSTR